MTEIIGVILAVITAVFIGYPLFQKQKGKASFALNHRSQELEARKKEIYAAIRDIDFDYQMGKLTKEDHAALREQYKTEAIGMMKQIDSAQIGKESRSEKAALAMSFCHHCGEPLAASARFCRACGGQLA